MRKNVGRADRLLRVGAGGALLLCSVVAPFPLLWRVLGFAVLGSYLLLTGFAGSCLGYRLMGKTSCPAKSVGLS